MSSVTKSTRLKCLSGYICLKQHECMHVVLYITGRWYFILKITIKINLSKGWTCKKICTGHKKVYIIFSVSNSIQIKYGTNLQITSTPKNYNWFIRPSGWNIWTWLTIPGPIDDGKKKYPTTRCWNSFNKTIRNDKYQKWHKIMFFLPTCKVCLNIISGFS